MQHTVIGRTKLAAGLLAFGLPAFGCTSSRVVMDYSENSSAAEEPPRFEFFTTDPLLHEASRRALQRIQTAIGEPGLALADPGAASRCEPFAPGCGFELSARDTVYCFGNPDPAKACTSLGARGKALGIALQADLAGDELDNRLIHELFHVITLNRAEHSADGLFMEYSVGDERITPSTLEAVCRHFACTQFVVEEAESLPAGTPAFRK